MHHLNFQEMLEPVREWPEPTCVKCVANDTVDAVFLTASGRQTASWLPLR